MLELIAKHNRFSAPITESERIDYMKSKKTIKCNIDSCAAYQSLCNTNYGCG